MLLFISVQSDAENVSILQGVLEIRVVPGVESMKSNDPLSLRSIGTFSISLG